MCKPDCLRTLQSRSKLYMSCLLIDMFLQNLEIAVLLDAVGPTFLITTLAPYCSVLVPDQEVCFHPFHALL